MLKRYPFDPTGQSTTNLVVGEIHHLDEDFDINMPRILFPRLGAYYNESLVVKLDDKVLKLNEDYLLTFFWQHATYMSGLPVSVAFQITNTKLKGTITIDYQVVGGEYQDRSEALSELMENFPQNTRNVFWDEVLEKPEAFIPTRHLHHINDVFGMSRFIDIIDQLRRSLEKQSVLKLKSVYSKFLTLKSYVEDNLEDIDSARRGLLELNRVVEERLLGYVAKDELSKELQQIYAELQTLTAETDKTLKDQITQLSNKFNEYNNNVTVDILRLSDSLNLYASELNDGLYNLNKKTNELKQAHSEQLKALTIDLTDKISEVQTASQLKDSEISSKLDKTITDVDNRLNEIEVSQRNTDNKLKNTIDISTLNDKVNDLTTLIQNSIKDIETDVNNNLNRLISESNADNNSMGEQITTISVKLAALEKLLETLSEYETIEDNDRKHAEIAESIEKINISLTNDVDNKLNELKSLFDNTWNDLNNTLNTSRDVIEKANTELNTLKESISDYITFDDLQQNSNTLKEDLTNTINALEQTVLEQRSKYNELEQQLSQLNTELINTPELLDNLQTEISERIKNIDGFETVERVAEIREELINLINNSVDTITNDIAGLTRDRAELTAKVDNLELKQLDIEGKINDLHDKDIELKTELTQLQQQLTSVNNQIANVGELGQQIEEQVNNLNDLNNEFTEFKDNTENVIRDLRDISNENNERFKGDIASLKEQVELNVKAIDELKRYNGNNYYDLSDWGDINKVNSSWNARQINYTKSTINNKPIVSINLSNNSDLTLNTKHLTDPNKSYRLSFYVRVNNVKNLDNLGYIEFDSIDIPITFMRHFEDNQWYVFVGYFGNTSNPNSFDLTVYNATTGQPIYTESLPYTDKGNSGVLNFNGKQDGYLIYFPGLYELNGEEPPLLDFINSYRELMSATNVDLTPINDKIDNLSIELNKRVDELNNEIDEEELKRLVYLKMHEIVADSRIEEAGNIDIPALIIYPDEADGVVFYDNVDGRSAYPISKMDNTLQTNELQRTVYTPNTIFEFDKTSVWTVPDLYDGLIAQVFVTTAARTIKLLNGNTLLYPPSTKMGYVRIKGGANVPIEVGTISSFGRFITNDGVSTKGLIQPTYPIVIPFTSGLEISEDINNYHGKLGKVTVIL